MLVVDRSVFAEFEADQAGLDFMELSANLIRAHGGRHRYAGSTPSILDSEATSKVLSEPCTPVGMSPPAYEDICDLPPSYSELGLSSVCVQSIKSPSSTNDHHHPQHGVSSEARIQTDERTSSSTSSSSSTGSCVVLRVSSDSDVHRGCYYEAGRSRPITKQLSL